MSLPTNTTATSLQEGIYLTPDAPLPRSFLFIVANVLPDTNGETTRRALQQIWETVRSVQAGKIHDLAATDADDPTVEIDPDTFHALLGYGSSFFDRDRNLTTAAKPRNLASLTVTDQPFPSLGWNDTATPGSGEGDLCIQLTGRDDHAVYRAAIEIWKTIHDNNLPIIIKSTHHGFARDDRRSWIGFHDGVSNIPRLQRLAAVECPGDPDWNRGGTYLAFLRCAVDLTVWRTLTRTEQELIVGRDKLTGCALERVDFDNGTPHPRFFAGCPARDNAGSAQPDSFRDPPETADPLVEASHIHRANQNRAAPTTAAGHRIFRQGYEYLDGIGPHGPRVGLNFISFQNDLEHLRQILGLQSWLGGTNFGGRKPTRNGEPDPPAILTLEAAGLYATPPADEPFPGARLLDESVDPHEPAN